MHTPSSCVESESLGDGSDVAKLAKVSERTVQTWTYSRKIPSIKIGRTRRYNMAAVQRALAKFTIEEVG
jgi:excisionase family DNA binding protein